MDFNEQTASELIEKFGLNKKTLAVWAHRGSIPDKYFQDGFNARQMVAGEHDEQLLQDVFRILSYGKINVSSLSRLTEIPQQRLSDIARRKLRMSKEELIAVKKAINALRSDAREIISLTADRGTFIGEAEKKLKKFLLRKELKIHVLIQPRDVAKKFDAWAHRENLSFPSRHVIDITQALMVFVTETSMM